MINVLKNLLVFLFSFLVSVPQSYGKVFEECPSDNTYIYEDTIFPAKICNVEDRREGPDDGGVIIIKANNIVLDCNGMVLNGTGYEYKKDYPHFRFGIFNHGFHNVTVKNCIIKNYMDGILFVNAKNARIFNNTLISNQNGVVIDNALPRFYEKWEREKFGFPNPKPDFGFNEIYNNTFISNEQGINLLATKNNFIFNNIITFSANYGIQIETSFENIISQNVIYSNRYGIFIVENSSNNRIFNNTISNSSIGVEIINSSENIFYNNIYLKNGEDIVQILIQKTKKMESSNLNIIILTAFILILILLIYIFLKNR